MDGGSRGIDYRSWRADCRDADQEARRAAINVQIAMPTDKDEEHAGRCSHGTEAWS